MPRSPPKFQGEVTQRQSRSSNISTQEEENVTVSLLPSPLTVKFNAKFVLQLHKLYQENFVREGF